MLPGFGSLLWAPRPSDSALA